MADQMLCVGTEQDGYTHKIPGAKLKLGSRETYKTGLGKPYRPGSVRVGLALPTPCAYHGNHHEEEYLYV